MRRRLEASRARSDTRDWAQARRTRTRQLIELGGLVQKAGLFDQLGSDQAVLLGALLALARQMDALPMEDAETIAIKDRWRQQGLDALRLAAVPLPVSQEGAGQEDAGGDSR